jgi:hypothetical protein
MGLDYLQKSYSRARLNKIAVDVRDHVSLLVEKDCVGAELGNIGAVELVYQVAHLEGCGIRGIDDPVLNWIALVLGLGLSLETSRQLRCSVVTIANKEVEGKARIGICYKGSDTADKAVCFVREFLRLRLFHLALVQK